VWVLFKKEVMINGSIRKFCSRAFQLMVLKSGAQSKNGFEGRSSEQNGFKGQSSEQNGFKGRSSTEQNGFKGRNSEQN
jgi:hypothetical protein